jgi:hypothetical protein
MVDPDEIKLVTGTSPLERPSDIADPMILVVEDSDCLVKYRLPVVQPQKRAAILVTADNGSALAGIAAHTE